MVKRAQISESDLVCVPFSFSISKMGRRYLPCRVVGEIRNIYELAHGRYSEVANDIKELGAWKGQDCENRLESAGNSFACKAEPRQWGAAEGFSAERHVVRSRF